MRLEEIDEERMRRRSEEKRESGVERTEQERGEIQRKKKDSYRV